MILSGTPVRNEAIDIFSQYRFLDPAIFGLNFYAFRSRYGVEALFSILTQNLPLRRGNVYYRAEYAPMLGAEVFGKSIDELTDREKYNLVFARLPINTPWLYLYREKYPPEPTFKERTDEYETI